jgi:DEAD/DEAH box helicase domain-containing protein
VIPVDVDYYTQTISDVDVQVLAEHAQRAGTMTAAAFGEVEVTAQVVGYRRIMRHTHTLLGVQPLEYPPQRLVTSAYWLAVQPEAQQALEQAGLWYDSVNDYGPNWAAVRKQVRARDHYRCTQCGAKELTGQEHDVHHLIPFRSFGYVRGANENYLLANRLENLVLVCRSCHQRLETAGRLRTGLDGLAYALGNLAPLHLMCDQSDLGVYVARSETHTALARAGRTAAADADVDFMGDAPPAAIGPAQAATGAQLATVYLYEQIPAGLGFSAALYDLHDTLLTAARALVGGCGCRRGCPACIGPVLDDQPMQLDTKALTLGLLDVITSTP